MLSAADRARAYERAGAVAVSVLTDSAHFGGSFDDLRAVRDAVTVPLLCKDFVVDERQLDWAVASGADLVLLIARILDDEALSSLGQAARSRGLCPLFEVATEDEVHRVVASGARVVGVNARDLDTLQMDATRAARVLAAIPRGLVALHLSGLRSPADVTAIAAGRVDGALVGEALMREDDPEPLLRALVQAAR